MSLRLISTHYIAEDGFELLTLLYLPSAGITGVYHHIQLQLKFLSREQRQECREMGDFVAATVSGSCDLSHIVAVSYRCNKLLEKNQLKGRKVCLGSWFLRFQPKVTGLFLGHGEADCHGRNM